MKLCTKCQATKPTSEFYSDKSRIDHLNVRCKTCVKLQRAQNKDTINKKRKEKGFWYPNKNKNQRSYRETLKGKMTAWKHSAKIRKIDWCLSLEELKTIPMTCFYTGIELTFISNLPNTVSLDRLNSSKDYSQENVVFSCEVINKMKQELTVQQFIEYCKLIVKKHGK